MPRVTVKLPPGLARRLKQVVGRRGTTQSAFIRQALEARLDAKTEDTSGSFLDLAWDLAGSLQGGPTDLSWTKRHARGFGR